MEWEYLTQMIPADKWQERCGELGGHGWELVHQIWAMPIQAPMELKGFGKVQAQGMWACVFKRMKLVAQSVKVD